MIYTGWRVQLTDAAKQDFAQIVRASYDRFGSLQASTYSTLILEAIGDLTVGPDAPGHRRHDGLAPGLRSRRVARRGRPSPHRLVFRAIGPDVIEVVRILHDRMDIPRHLPPEPT